MSSEPGRKHGMPVYALCGALLFVALLLGTAASRAAVDAGASLSGDKAEPGAPAWSPDCWLLVSNPFTDGNLLDVDMLSSSEAWAVGESGGAGLVARWDGTAWSQAYTAPGSSEIYAVSALSSTNAWAVGQGGSTGSALRWDGTAWSPVEVPTPASVGLLRDVALIDADNAWAVGHYTSGYTSYPLIVQWDGTGWTLSPAPGTGMLHGVFAAAPDDIWAVGDQGLPEPLVMHWDGSAWSSWPVPPIVTQSSLLNSISGTSPSDIWAVGSSMIVNGYSGPLIMHWDGIGWTTITSPDTSPYVPLPDYSWLSSIVALSSTDAWAVGGRGASVFRWPILMRWDGVGWSYSSTEHLVLSNVNGVDAVSATQAWAVGLRSGAFTARFQEGPCPTPTATPTPPTCARVFSDVLPGDTFYPFVQCLACRDIIQGYDDHTFRPNNPVTRGQIAKIVSNSAGLSDPPGAQMFEDVPPGSTFYEWVQRLASRGYIGGYACGGPSEPCGPAHLPYFRPNSGATRGQLTKIVSNAAGFTDTIPDTHYTFADVPPAHPFWVYIERLLLNRPGVMGGYPCGGPGEPCDGLNRAYFRPDNPLTRGQAAKIVSSTFFPGCQQP